MLQTDEQREILEKLIWRIFEGRTVFVRPCMGGWRDMKNEMNEFVGSGRLEFPEVEPWMEAVDGAALLDEIRTVLKRFTVLPQWGAEALALWVLHTYAFHLRDVTTYIGISS